VVGHDDVLGRHLAGVADDHLERRRLADLNFGRGEFFDHDGRLLYSFELAFAGRRGGAVGGSLCLWDRDRRGT
jgi:hypothetical protein